MRTITRHTEMSKITRNVWKFNQINFFNDCLITLISYLHTQHDTCVVTRRHFSLNALLHTSQTIWTLNTMHVSMCYQTGLITVCLVTNISNIRVLTTMQVLFYKSVLVRECFITHITSIRVVTTMNALMCYQIALLTESLITYFTTIKALTSMYALMF